MMQSVLLCWDGELGGLGVRLAFDLETVNFFESQDLDIFILSPLCLCVRTPYIPADITTERASFRLCCIVLRISIKSQY